MAATIALACDEIDLFLGEYFFKTLATETEIIGSCRAFDQIKSRAGIGRNSNYCKRALDMTLRSFVRLLQIAVGTFDIWYNRYGPPV